MRIGVPLETRPGETRVAATPETVKKLTAQGHQVVIQSGAGIGASQPDSAYEAVGAKISSKEEVYAAELVLKVRAPFENELSLMTTIRFESDTYHQYDLRDPISKILQPDNQSITNKTHISPKEWAHIPYNQAANQRALSIQQQRNNNNYNQIETLHQPQQVEKIQQQIQQQLREIEQQQKMNVFSARYAQAVKQKSKVGKTANIGLGGVR
jgi:hypothetical protein